MPIMTVTTMVIKMKRKAFLKSQDYFFPSFFFPTGMKFKSCYKLGKLMMEVL